jgi:hypothetical protein
VSEWMLGGPGRRQQPDEEGYNVMQVCLNGHRITDAAATYPHDRKQFCDACGEKRSTSALGAMRPSRDA